MNCMAARTIIVLVSLLLHYVDARRLYISDTRISSRNNVAVACFWEDSWCTIKRDKPDDTSVSGEIEQLRESQYNILRLRGGGSFLPAGWNPLGYAITELGKKFLEFDGSRECDVGRFIASLKSGRKTKSTIKEQWLEILRVSKSAQSMRVYRQLSDLIKFCLDAGFID
jgi:hypothetical protein